MQDLEARILGLNPKLIQNRRRESQIQLQGIQNSKVEINQRQFLRKLIEHKIYQNQDKAKSSKRQLMETIFFQR